jgi:hypothetical protein
VQSLLHSGMTLLANSWLDVVMLQLCDEAAAPTPQ